MVYAFFNLGYHDTLFDTFPVLVWDTYLISCV